MATKTTKSTIEELSIPAIDIRIATITLVGDSPLIMHRWDEKAKKEILDKQMQKAKTKGHDVKDPVRDFIVSMYWLAGEPLEKTEAGFAAAMQSGKAKFGFPAVAFKAAAVSAGYRAGITKNKVVMNGAFHINEELVEIEGIPEMREDMVMVGGMSRVADIRYRGEFKSWRTTFDVRYNAAVLSLEQLCNLFNIGGFACGVGEWRAEKGGSYGMFHIE